MLLLCIPSLLFAGGEDNIGRTYALDRDGKVYLLVKSGDIVVNTWNKNEIRLIAHQNTTADINRTEGNIRIIISRSQSSHYELSIPDKAQLRVETASGKVEARGIGGLVDIRTASGDIEVVTVKNGIRCRSVSGDIRVEGITGNAELETTSGKIRVEGIRGSVKAGTVSGKIEIHSFSRGEEVEIESISGNIKLYGELTPGGIYRISSHSGNIEMGMPSGSDFEVRVDTFSGTVRCNFELKVSGKIERGKVYGVVGKGRASLILSSFSGNIRIAKH
jgi:DUF4097 and DUF4098 domain-containing protein YvlB